MIPSLLPGMFVSIPKSTRLTVLTLCLGMTGLSGCLKTIQPLTATPAVKGDLLVESRLWRQKTSLAEARDRLSEALLSVDASQGRLEKDIAHANRDKSWILPNSIHSLPRRDRERTGIILVLGFNQKEGDKPKMVKLIVKELRKRGWQASLVQLGEWGTPEENAKAIDAHLRRELPKVDRAIAVGFSKGGDDWVHWVLGPARSMPLAEREKIRVSLQFAPILRGSAAAKFITETKGPLGAYIRNKVRKTRESHEDRRLEDVAAIANDPWVEHPVPSWKEILPHLTAVHYVALPDDAKGLPSAPSDFRLFSKLVAWGMPWSGPLDGLVESAAQVFPPGETTPQWVVRVRGSHALLNGRYVQGGDRTSELYWENEEEGWRGGLEMMDAFMRAFPRATVGW